MGIDMKIDANKETDMDVYIYIATIEKGDEDIRH